VEGKIDWQAVEEKPQSWDYKTQGLTEAGECDRLMHSPAGA